MFGRRITLFKLFGFAVRIDASWLIIAALVTWTLAAGVFPYYYPGLPGSHYLWMGMAGAVLLFASIIVHEMSHSLVARRYGIPMKGITLFVFGGIAEMDEEPADPNSEFMMAIAGPVASIVTGFMFYGIEQAVRSPAPVEATGVLAYVSRINWLLAVFNLIPAFPLDGGRVLRSLLWHHHHNLRRATRTAARIGGIFGGLMIAYAVAQLFFGDFVGAVWWFLIGMFLRSAALSSYEHVVVRAVLQGEPVRRFMHREPDTVTPDISIEQFVNDYIYRYHHRMFPVMAGPDRLAGCVSTEEVKNVPREEWPAHRVGEIVKPCSSENTITPETDSIEALRLMQRSHNTRLMVVENGRVVGIVALKDLLGFLNAKLSLEGESPAALHTV